jgi:hypothetical protein
MTAMIKRISAFALILMSSVMTLWAQEIHVKFKFGAQKISDCEYDLKFNATIDEGWHL